MQDGEYMANWVHPIEQLIHSTVRIECETTDGVCSGSGYFFGFLASEKGNAPCIITNKHVVKGSIRGKFHLTLKDKSGNPELGKHIPITFDNFESHWINHPDPDVDLSLFPLAPLFYEADRQNIKFYYKLITKNAVASSELLEKISTMEEIIMIGYPNGIWDSKHNLPVIRRGITATHPKLSLNGKPEFMIDAACFPGSSGSPVFLANFGSYLDEKGDICMGNRLALLGTLYAGPQHTVSGEIKVIEIPTVNTPIPITSIPNNLGLVINASKTMDFESIMQDEISQQNKSTA